MAVHNYPSDLGWTVGGTNSDTGVLNLGTCFTLTAAANVTGVRFYSPNSQTVAGQLWAAGTKVAETTGASVTAGWNTITFSSPYSATTSVLYIASILLPSGAIQYTSVTNQWTDGTDSVEVILGPAFWDDSENNRYTYGTTVPAIPSGTSGPWFGIDAIIDDLASGDADVDAVTATATGAAVAPVVTGSIPGNVNAVCATGTASAVAPTVAGVLNGSVTAVRATATGQVEIPAIDVITTITGGGAATGTGLAIPPTVSATDAGQVTAVTATGTGLARVPTVTTGAIVTGAAAAGTGTARVPTISGGDVTALPAAVTFGSVKGWLGKGVNQAPDADGYADLVAAQGTVTFAPTVSVLLFPAASPDPLVLIPEVVVATLDEDGYLIGTKTGGTEKLARLIVGTWTVTYQLTGVTLPSHPVTITGGATVDLVTVIPT